MKSYSKVPRKTLVTIYEMMCVNRKFHLVHDLHISGISLQNGHFHSALGIIELHVRIGQPLASTKSQGSTPLQCHGLSSLNKASIRPAISWKGGRLGGGWGPFDSQGCHLVLCDFGSWTPQVGGPNS